jgi:hypothetical protein
VIRIDTNVKLATFGVLMFWFGVVIGLVIAR